LKAQLTSNKHTQANFLASKFSYCLISKIFFSCEPSTTGVF
jgi:hypothetical protein